MIYRIKYENLPKKLRLSCCMFDHMLDIQTNLHTELLKYKKKKSIIRDKTTLYLINYDNVPVFLTKLL